MHVCTCITLSLIYGNCRPLRPVRAYIDFCNACIGRCRKVIGLGIVPGIAEHATYFV